jgi:hypothetical protein
MAGDNDFVKNPAGIVLNINRTEIQQARELKAIRKAKILEDAKLKEDVKELKNEMIDIKDMLTQLLEK